MFGIYVKAGSIDLQVIVMTQLITTLSVTHECAASPPTDLWLLSGYEVWKKVKMFRKASKVYVAAVAKSYSRKIDCFSFWKWLKISASLVLFSDPPQKLEKEDLLNGRVDISGGSRGGSLGSMEPLF